MTASCDTPGLARLLRWEDAGGTWQVVGLGAGRASVALCRCDGGEEVERLTSSDPELLAVLEESRDAQP